MLPKLAALAAILSTAAAANSQGEYTDWSTFKANGVNLGGWFEIELSNDPEIYEMYAPNATDEWTFCETLGDQCGPVLNERYATFITCDDIDRLAAVGVNFLRIPMTYAARIVVPGSELHTGTQAKSMRAHPPLPVTTYAIEKYGIRVAIGLHSLPGGVNTLDIGEAYGHDAWFFNTTNLDYSWQAVDNILTFINHSPSPWAYSIEVINEAADDFSGFGTSAGLTTSGAEWVVKYTQGALDRAAAVDPRITIVLQDCFSGEERWSPYFDSSANLVIDTHIYYFAAAGVYSQYVAGAICGQGSVAGGDLKFPVFIGEWSLQVQYNNTLVNRQTIFNTQRYAWEKYVAGGSFWTAKFNGSAAVSGEGTQKDYWNYEGLIDAGVITLPDDSVNYCA